MNTRAQHIKLIARTAGEAVRKAVPTDGVIEKEGRANIVTAADLESEKIIMEMIRENFPDDEILSEETTSTIEDPLKTERLWVIDPIDGTNNFRYQRNYSAVSIGYVESGKMKLAAAYDPFRDELFFAEKGKGAFLNEKKISVGEGFKLSTSMIATDNSTDSAGTRFNLELLLKMKETPWVMMRGSAVLIMCDVAAGRIDLYFHNFLKPWDNAAAFLIATEAGATIKDFHGAVPTFMSNEVVMGNQKLVEQFLTAVSKK